MTRKETQRRLAGALREQRSAEEEVSETNARVVEATRKLPPHYIHRRFAPGERERIQQLVDRAQRASDRLGAVTADVVNLRSLVQSQGPSGRRHASPARIQQEIDEVLARKRGRS